MRGSGWVWGKAVTGAGGGRLWKCISHVVDWCECCTSFSLRKHPTRRFLANDTDCLLLCASICAGMSVSRCLADATFVEIAGGKVPAGKDSISMWSALKSGGPSPRSEVLLQLAGPDATTGLQEKDAAIRIGPWKLIINVDGRDRCPNSANVSGMSGDAQQNSCFYSNSGWMAMLP